MPSKNPELDPDILEKVCSVVDARKKYLAGEQRRILFAASGIVSEAENIFLNKLKNYVDFLQESKCNCPNCQKDRLRLIPFYEQEALRLDPRGQIDHEEVEAEIRLLYSRLQVENHTCDEKFLYRTIKHFVKVLGLDRVRKLVLQYGHPQWITQADWEIADNYLMDEEDWDLIEKIKNEYEELIGFRKFSHLKAVRLLIDLYGDERLIQSMLDKYVVTSDIDKKKKKKK